MSSVYEKPESVFRPVEDAIFFALRADAALVVAVTFVFPPAREHSRAKGGCNQDKSSDKPQRLLDIGWREST
ncbi:MAG: hypothetical protein FRX49_13459 [Trebouxia sp. A1-2]|nr:MAG: hypothetical protein FRX49_13459 [Trebouxia sp. A1-2]